MNIGYCRVSTNDQNTDLQVDALKKEDCRKIFQESISGASRERPQLTAAMEYAREGDVLVVWSLSRLGRSLKQLLETVELLDASGIGLKSLKENIDTTTPAGRLIFHVFGALAEFERDHLRERTVEGLKAARARGRVGGRRPVLSDSDVRAARAMLRDPSITVKEVAEKLKVGRTTLYRALGSGGRSSLTAGVK